MDGEGGVDAGRVGGEKFGVGEVVAEVAVGGVGAAEEDLEGMICCSVVLVLKH